MTLLYAVILGAIQGLTEFLPISSTAHLIALPWLFHWDDPTLRSKPFDIALHTGTLLALIVYFRKDLLEVIVARDRRLLTLIVVGCLPLPLVALIDKRVEHYSTPGEWPYAPLLIAFFLITFGVLLQWADARGRKQRDMDRMNVADALLVGLAQCIAAACPGASRSGSTMTFALFRGLSREAAVRFSFLLSVPTIGGVIVYAVIRHGHEMVGAGIAPVAVGIGSSAIFGYAAVAFLMEYVRRHGMHVFFWYRIAAGIALVALYFLRR